MVVDFVHTLQVPLTYSLQLLKLAEYIVIRSLRAQIILLLNLYYLAVSNIDHSQTRRKLLV